MSEKIIREKFSNSNLMSKEVINIQYETIKNCNFLSMCFGLGQISLPNIVVTYNSKMIELQKHFENVGIDFFDETQCKTKIILQKCLQKILLSGNNSLRIYQSIFVITPQQVKDFVDSYKQPNIYEKEKGKKYEPKDSILTAEQMDSANSCLEYYEDCNNTIKYFSIKYDIIEAILYYRSLSMPFDINSSEFDSILKQVDYELQSLGYNSIEQIVKNEISNISSNIQFPVSFPSIMIPD